MKDTLFKSVIVIATLCAAALAQTSVSPSAKEPVSGVQSPYTQQADQVQDTRPKVTTGRARWVPQPVQDHSGSSRAHERARPQEEHGDAGSQLCFVPGHGYLPRVNGGCPTPDDATVGTNEAQKTASVKKATVDVNPQFDPTKMKPLFGGGADVNAKLDSMQSGMNLQQEVAPSRREQRKKHAQEIQQTCGEIGDTQTQRRSAFANDKKRNTGHCENARRRKKSYFKTNRRDGDSRHE